MESKEEEAKRLKEAMLNNLRDMSEGVKKMKEQAKRSIRENSPEIKLASELDISVPLGRQEEHDEEQMSYLNSLKELDSNPESMYIPSFKPREPVKRKEVNNPKDDLRTYLFYGSLGLILLYGGYKLFGCLKSTPAEIVPEITELL